MIVILALWPSALQCQLSALLIRFVFCFVWRTKADPRAKGRELVGRKLVQAPSNFIPRQLFCFGFLVNLDVARCYLWLFSLYINIKIGKNSC